MAKFKIKNLNHTPPTIRFRDVSVGSIFTYKNELYYKTITLLGDCSVIVANAVSLSNSKISRFFDDESVTTCDATLEYMENRPHNG